MRKRSLSRPREQHPERTDLSFLNMKKDKGEQE